MLGASLIDRDNWLALLKPHPSRLTTTYATMSGPQISDALITANVNVPG
jgi:hypothetical protein